MTEEMTEVKTVKLSRAKTDMLVKGRESYSKHGVTSGCLGCASCQHQPIDPPALLLRQVANNMPEEQLHKLIKRVAACQSAE